MRLSLIAVLFIAATASAQVPTGQSSTVDFATVDQREQTLVTEMLTAQDWPYRVFGLLRLEAYTGASVETFVRGAVSDGNWPVRCFALRCAERLGIEIDPALLAEETEPRVIRAALRCGVAIPDDVVVKGAKHLMRQRDTDELLLGLEIAAASSNDDLRREAERRIIGAVRGMGDADVPLVSRRLGAIVGVHPAPDTVYLWRQYFEANGGVTLVDPAAMRDTLRRAAPTSIATMDLDTLSRLRDYLGALKQRDLEMCIVMDATASMTRMIHGARAGAVELIHFLNDISASMLLAFVAYRDHDNEPVWEGHPFTDDVEEIQRFIYNVRITGGADYPEAVLDGITACGQLEWSPRAERTIVLVGDAPPHEEDGYKLRGALEEIRAHEITVHTVHVPFVYQDDRMYNQQGAEEWLANFNRTTQATFEDIATAGGGQATQLIGSTDLVPQIMRFTILEGWWTVFDEFYGVYVDMCR